MRHFNIIMRKNSSVFVSEVDENNVQIEDFGADLYAALAILGDSKPREISISWYVEEIDF